MKKYLQYLKLVALPFLALIEIEDYTIILGFALYLLAMILFLHGAFRIFQLNKLNAVLGIVIALSLTFSFWNDLFKSEILATAYKGGDMQDFHGQLVLKKNGHCEIYNQSFMSSGRCNAKYKIMNGAVIIDGCMEWVSEFDSIQVGNAIYVIKKTL